MKFEKITDYEYLRNGYYYIDGFVFTTIDGEPNVYDAIAVKIPRDVPCYSPRMGGSFHSLQEHIDYINKNQLEKILIIAENIDFITQCPGLKTVDIVPADTAGNNFDFSPLYEMPEIRSLSCATNYGHEFQLSSQLDYSKIKGLVELSVSGTGHINFEKITTLKHLGVGGFKGKKRDMTELFSSPILESLTLIQCNIQSLNGIDRSSCIKSIVLYYNRSLKDMSALRKVVGSLKELVIEVCGGIKDWSFLYELTNLEVLVLNGSNELPSLDFIRNMKKLKFFTFSMNVKDGDLTPCLSVQYARCDRGRKHYNLKDKDLPKDLPKNGMQV